MNGGFQNHKNILKCYTYVLALLEAHGQLRTGMQEKWIMKFFKGLTLILFASFMVTVTGIGCKNGFEKENTFITVKGILTSSVERTAIPTKPTTIHYTVEAKKNGTTVNANVTGNNFSIKLTPGTWNFTAKGFSDPSKTKQVFEGKKSITLDSTTLAVEDISLSVTYISNASGKGKVNLPIEIETATNITKIVAKWKENGAEKTKTITPSSGKATFNMIYDSAPAGVDTVSSGSYMVDFALYDSNNILLYSCSESVNVFDNIETNTWISSAADGMHLSQDGDKFIMKITKALVEDFIPTVFYVNGEGGKIGTEGNDSNTGGYYSPLKTVGKAAEKIKDSPLKEKEYTIILSGKSTESAPIEIRNKIKIIKFENDTGNYATIKRADLNTKSMIEVINNTTDKGKLHMEGIELDGDKKNVEPTVGGAGIYAEGKIELQNCSIKNCWTWTPSNSKSGGGIYLAKDAKDSVINSTQITDCVALNSGSAIYSLADFSLEGNTIVDRCLSQSGGTITVGSSVIASQAKATCTLKGDTLIGNKNKFEEYDESFPHHPLLKLPKMGNRSSQGCGGITVYNGSLVIENGSGMYISGNKGYSGGGGIRLYKNTELIMESGVIQNNISDKKGGGIYNEGTIYMSGTAIVGDSTKTDAPLTENESSNQAENGGGIYNDSNGKIYIGYKKNAEGTAVKDASFTGGVYCNHATSNGGGIHNAGTLHIGKGTIGYNTSKESGGGIFNTKTLQILGEKDNPVSIIGNTGAHGGGLCFNAGSNNIKLEYCDVKNNKAVGNTTTRITGGGIYVAEEMTATSVTLSSCIIEGNTISTTQTGKNAFGAGIYSGLKSPTKLTGNTIIKGNKWEGDFSIKHGKGIYIPVYGTGTSGVVELEEKGIEVGNKDDDNDIYLPAYGTTSTIIQIASPAPASGNPSFVRITVYKLVDGTKVISGSVPDDISKIISVAPKITGSGATATAKAFYINRINSSTGQLKEVAFEGNFDRGTNIFTCKIKNPFPGYSIQLRVTRSGDLLTITEWGESSQDNITKNIETPSGTYTWIAFLYDKKDGTSLGKLDSGTFTKP